MSENVHARWPSVVLTLIFTRMNAIDYPITLITSERFAPDVQYITRVTIYIIVAFLYLTKT